jgi:hypothetical protein
LKRSAFFYYGEHGKFWELGVILTKNCELLLLKKKLRSFFTAADDDRVVTLTLPSFDRSGKNQSRLRIWSKIFSAPEFVPTQQKISDIFLKH